MQDFVEKHWNEHGKPAAEVVIQKVLQLIAEWRFEDFALSIVILIGNHVRLLTDKLHICNFQALEKKAQAGKWAEPHVEAVKTVS